MTSSLSAEARLGPTEAEKSLLKLRSEHPGLVLQLVTVNEIPSAKAVQMIAAQTLRAMEAGGLLASRPEVDLLLRLAGTGQIAVAMSTSGYKEPGTKMLVAAGDEGELEKLREALLNDRRFKVMKGDKIDRHGLALVERAALLGVRV